MLKFPDRLLECCGGILLCMATTVVNAGGPSRVLSLSELEEAVISADAGLLQIRANVQADRERVMPAGELPDPQLKLVAQNLPVDTFDLDQEPMTQTVIGLQQRFPAGKTREVKTHLAEARVEESGAELASKRARLLRSVRKSWLEVYAADQRITLLDAQRARNLERLRTVEAAYHTGRTTRSEVLDLKLALAVLDDEQAMREGKDKAARAALGQWLDEASTRAWPAVLPPVLRRLPEGEVTAHPELRVLASRRRQSALDMELAREARKPDWALETRYGWRDGRTDFLTVGVTTSLPLFAGRRQDRTLAAARHDYTAAGLANEDKERRLRAQWRALRVSAAALRQRLHIHSEDILPEYGEKVRLAEIDYASGRASLQSVLNAEVDEIKARRGMLDLEIELAGQIIELLYLGEGNP